MVRITSIIVGFILLGFIGTCIYFVAGVSATIPPIKKYEFSGNVDQLFSAIHKFIITNPNVTLKITDTTGNKENGYGIYMDIKIKLDTNVFSYNLECERSDKDDYKSKTLIKLIGAFNEKNYKVGGYGINGVGVNKMVNDFELNFLIRLKQQHYTITEL